MSEDRIERLTPSRMKERGWTTSMIKRLLGEPDAFATNPNYRSGHPMRLYDLSRIEAAEASDAFAALQQKAKKRSASATAVTDRKRQELLEEVRLIKIDLGNMSYKQLTNEAIRHYNWWNSDKPNYTPASDKSDKPFLDRIRVNYARHELTIYDDRLEALYARIGRLEAEHAIRCATYEAIAKAWPLLAEECQQQLERRMIF